MRAVTTFKGYRSVIEYNPETGEFESAGVPGEGQEPSLDEMLVALADVLPITFEDLMPAGAGARAEDKRDR